MKTPSQKHDGSPIRVLIVDDHPMMRNGLQSFLAVTPGLLCVGEAASGEEAIDLCAHVNPHVVIMDLSMPGMGGVAATQALGKTHPDIAVIVLTSFAEPDLVKEAIAAGAIGYLLKHVSASTLAEAVQAAANGRPTMGPEAVDALIHVASHPNPVGSDLTVREREVLQHLAMGMTNIEIARAMEISEATARFHVGNILSKLDAGNRTEAVQIAFRLKLVE